MIYIVLAGALAYLIGSVPTAVWLGEALYGVDVREHGSGNAGATNTFRVLGKKAGVAVLAVDIFKGWAATSIASVMISYGVVVYDDLVLYELLFGSLAVIGHIFPVFVGFRGGKGVATLLGMISCIYIEVALMSLGVFLIVLLISKYVSLGSMLAALSFPVFCLLPMFAPEEPALIVFGFLVFSILVITHKKNIKRLLNGEESKTFLIKIRNQ